MNGMRKKQERKMGKKHSGGSTVGEKRSEEL